MNAFPNELSLSRHIRPFPLDHSFFSIFFDFKVQVNWNYWKLLGVLSCFKMLVWTNLWSLKGLEDFNGFFLNGLSQLFQELDMIIFRILFAPLTVIRRRHVNLELQQWINNFINVLINPNKIIFNQMSLSDFNPFFPLFFFAKLRVN